MLPHKARGARWEQKGGRFQMATMKCPKCGRALDATGLAPDSGITCACGNVTAVSAGGTRQKTLYIILGVVVVLVACPCVVGVLSAIAIPNFIRGQARSKQSECKTHLKAWYTAQKAHYADANAYEPTLSRVGFAPERGNRYAYFAGEGPVEVRTQGQTEPTEGAVAVSVDTFRYGHMQPSPRRTCPRTWSTGWACPASAPSAKSPWPVRATSTMTRRWMCGSSPPGHSPSRTRMARPRSLASP